MYKLIVIIPFLVLALACNNPSGAGSGQEADTQQHVDEASQYTLFGEQLEFFIEHGPLVAGEETEFLVHLTRLDTYEPCSTGNVTILIDGVSATSGQPSTPGIFPVPFIPKTEGEFQAEFIYMNGNEREVVEEHVQIYKDHEAILAAESVAGGHTHGAETVGEIIFLKEQAWKSKFMVNEIVPGPFRAVIATSGEIVSMPGEKKNVAASGQGIVRFVDTHLVQGSSVKKGQLLFTLSSENLVVDNVKLRYEEAKNRLDKSRSQYQRHQILKEQEAISQRQYQESRSAYIEDSLRYYSLATNISEGGIMVTAPVSGTIHELMISDGEYTEPGKILAILSTNRNLMLRADLPQQYYGQLKEIETANFRPAYTDQVFTVEEMNGSLLAAGVSVAENNHYLPVIFRLENEGQLLEGAFVEVYLLTSAKHDVISVPVGALGEEQGGNYLYVQMTGESYSKRYVATGQHNGLLVEITSGLQPGDRVVTEGLTLVKAASMATGEISDGHTH
ncbi:MAG: efflux RND transporter periplasmic adaptor subunit [Bacteroidia bacterium]|nr:MAG: efflux RND transporter periplasmic adaptor subunit [Bacteroidia bacterium]